METRLARSKSMMRRLPDKPNRGDGSKIVARTDGGREQGDGRKARTTGVEKDDAFGLGYPQDVIFCEATCSVETGTSYGRVK